VADELFFAGTLIEIQPISTIDSYTVGIGGIGPVTERLQEAYLATVTDGRDDPHEWFTPVYGGVAAYRT
jgi:branched-chain amino acid aminotransferase